MLLRARWGSILPPTVSIIYACTHSHSEPRPMMESRAEQYAHTIHNRLTVRFGHALQLVLLLDGIRVAASLRSVDQLFSQALGNALDIAEGGLAGTDGEESDGLVDAAKRGHIDGLATDGTGGTDTGAVFARTAVDDGIDGDLYGVLVRHDVDDLESVRDD